jgi:hypothetical protein
MIKLNDKVTYRKVEESILIITPWDNAMHTLDDVGALIFDLLLSNKSNHDIANEIIDKYDIDIDTAENDLKELIDSLIKREIFIQEV